MDFIYLLRVLLKRKWIILGAAIIAASLTFYLTRNEQRKFKSSSRISTGFAIRDAVTVDPSIYDPYQADTRFGNVIEEFQTPQVLNLLGYQLLLHDLSDPKAFRRPDEKTRALPAYQAVNIENAKKVFKTKLDSLQTLSPYDPEEKKLMDFQSLYGYDAGSVQRSLNVGRVARTDYMQIDALTEHPELSAYMVNNVLQQYLRYFSKVRKVNINQSIDTLKAIMDKKKQELDIKNALLNRMNGGSADGSGMAVAGELRQTLQLERSKKTQKEFELKRINAKIAAINSGGGSTSPAVTGEDAITARAARDNAYADWQADLGNKAKEDKYNRLQSDYINILNALQESRNSGGNTNAGKIVESKTDLLDKREVLDFEIKGLDKSITQYEDQISILEGQSENIIINAGRIETSKRERDQANQEYLEARSAYNQANDVTGLSINNFRQTVAGQPSMSPEPSKRKVMVAAAGTVAMITTMLIIIFLTYLDTSIKTPVIFSKAVNLKLISLVNFMDMKEKKIQDIVVNQHHSETIVDRNKFNAFRESIRKLRYEIENTGKKVFLFTSTKKGQGKTTLIQALSYSLSLSKKKILIIDTNFCNPDLTVQLNADPVLEKIAPFSKNGISVVEQVRKVSKDIGLGTVYAIGAEGGDYTPSEVLPRENILHHLKELTSEYDYIFLEGPPLNDFSDSKELAQYVDGVIAVFSATHIIKQIDKQSISFFKELNGKFCGSILNMVDLKNVNVT